MVEDVAGPAAVDQASAFPGGALKDRGAAGAGVCRGGVEEDLLPGGGHGRVGPSLEGVAEGGRLGGAVAAGDGGGPLEGVVGDGLRGGGAPVQGRGDAREPHAGVVGVGAVQVVGRGAAGWLDLLPLCLDFPGELVLGRDAVRAALDVGAGELDDAALGIVVIIHNLNNAHCCEKNKYSNCQRYKYKIIPANHHL